MLVLTEGDVNPSLASIGGCAHIEEDATSIGRRKRNLLTPSDISAEPSNLLTDPCWRDLAS
jgi:hypothetical protein